MNVATHILLATDFSEASAAAVTMAGELARRFDAKLTVLRVHGHPPEPPEAVVPPERLIWSVQGLNMHSAEAPHTFLKAMFLPICTKSPDLMMGRDLLSWLMSQAVRRYLDQH